MMKLKLCATAVGAVLASSAMVATAEAKGNCVRAGGEATMITEGLAKFMAEAALKNSISGMNAKPVGKVALTCTSGFASTSCTAKQKACK